MLKLPSIDLRILLVPFILFLVLEVQLSVLEPDHVLDLKVDLVVVVLLLLTLQGLKLEWDLKLVLQSIYVVLLYYCEMRRFMPTLFLPFPWDFLKDGSACGKVGLEIIDGE